MAETKPAPKEPPYALPLTLTVFDVVSTGAHIHVASSITDADGKSVQSFPVTVDGKTSAEELSQTLQASVTQIAQAMAKRGEASVPEAESPKPEALASLKGKTFYGSVVR